MIPEQFLFLLRRTCNELHSFASRKSSSTKNIEPLAERGGSFGATE